MERTEFYFEVDRSARRKTLAFGAGCSAVLATLCWWLGLSLAYVIASAGALSVVVFAIRVSHYKKPVDQQAVAHKMYTARERPWALTWRLLSLAALLLLITKLPIVNLRMLEGEETVLAQANALNATSPQTEANKLTKLAAAIQDLRNERRSIPARDLEEASEKVQQVVIAKPQVVQGWKVASELVSYRSELLHPQVPSDIPNCLGEADIALEQLQNSIARHDPSTTFKFAAGNCRLDLDVPDEYHKSSLSRFFEAVDSYRPGSGHNISLTSVVVVYSGGPMLPIDNMSLVNCIFIFDPPAAVPPAMGQKLTSSLLTADLRATQLDFAQPALSEASQVDSTKLTLSR